MMMVTFAVWVYMYLRRTSYLLREKVDLRKVDTPAKMDVGVPIEINLPAYSLKNQFELPVVFYALCIHLYVTSSVDQFYLIAAWAFVFGRLAHALIYCSYNKVMHRFYAYFLSALVLWAIVARAAIAAFG